MRQIIRSTLKKIIFSKGNGEPVWSGKAVLVHENEIRITWEIPGTANLKVIGNDQAKVVIYNETNDTAVNLSRTATRLDLSLTLMIPDAYIGHKLHLWMFFASPDGKSVSNTDYIGSV
jgi:hypothetical protein